MRITPLMFVYIRTMPIFSKQSCIVSSCGTRRTAKLPAPTESSELDQHYRQQSVVSVPSQIIFAIDPTGSQTAGEPQSEVFSTTNILAIQQFCAAPVLQHFTIAANPVSSELA